MLSGFTKKNLFKCEPVQNKSKKEKVQFDNNSMTRDTFRDREKNVSIRGLTAISSMGYFFVREGGICISFIYSQISITFLKYIYIYIYIYLFIHFRLLHKYSGTIYIEPYVIS